MRSVDSLMRMVISKIPKEKQIDIAATIAFDNYNTNLMLNCRGELRLIDGIKMIPYNFIGQFLPEDILKEGEKRNSKNLEKLYNTMEKELKGVKISIYPN